MIGRNLWKTVVLGEILILKVSINDWMASGYPCPIRFPDIILYSAQIEKTVLKLEGGESNREQWWWGQRYVHLYLDRGTDDSHRYLLG